MSIDRSTMLACAAHMRCETTEAERRLWVRPRASQLAGHKFRRQAVMGGRIADFFCPAKGLIVEIDGETHEATRDAARDAHLRAGHGFVTLRFHNEDVMENPEGVLQKVLATLAAMPDRWPGCTTPNPSSEEEGRNP